MMKGRKNRSLAEKEFGKARLGRYAIGAFNASTLEALKAVINAAVKMRAPVIIEASPGEVDFIGIDILISIVDVYRRQYRIPIMLNLDHAKDPAKASLAIRKGFDLVHFDGSKLEPDKNTAILKGLAVEARRQNVMLEGERENIPGHSTLHRNRRHKILLEKLTDPLIARQFVRQSGVDVLAVSVGEAHGLFSGPKHIDIERIRSIRKTTSAFLSLHGGSGIPPAVLRAAVTAGITKVNVNTELRLAYRTSFLRSLTRKRTVVPYELLPEVIDSIEKVVIKKIKILGSAGKA